MSNSSALLVEKFLKVVADGKPAAWTCANETEARSRALRIAELARKRGIPITIRVGPASDRAERLPDITDGETWATPIAVIGRRTEWVIDAEPGENRPTGPRAS